MSELCKLCMRNILDSSFPPDFCLPGCVVNCMFTLPMLSPSNPHRWKKKKKKKRVGRVWLEVVSFICHPGLFDLPPYGTLLNEDESCINTGGHREMPSRTQIHARKVKKKNCERDKKQTGARNSRNTNPTGTHIHPSIRLLRTHPRGL